MSSTTTREAIEQFRQEARDWLVKASIPTIPEGNDARFDTLRAWQRQLHAAGWLGLTWPVDSGGRGLTALHQAVFNQELARARAPRPAGVVGIEVVGPTILQFGSEEQRHERLNRVLSGDDIWCQGFSEPNAGSDLASLSTTAHRVDGGYVVNGHKVWTTWSQKATWCALLARTDPNSSKHRGISYFLIPLDTPGITVKPLVQLDGDSDFGEVLFEDVFVDESALVGEENMGWSYAMHTLSSERGTLVLRRTADLSVMFADLLEQLARGGSHVSEIERSRIGRLSARLFALEAQCERIVERVLANPNDPSAHDSLDKAFMTGFEQDLTGFAHECLGTHSTATGLRPRGMDSTRWIHDYYYGRAASIYGGSAQIQRNIISERLLGLPREAR